MQKKDKSSLKLILNVPGTAPGKLFMAWPNNDTGHWNIFFAMSSNGGKTMSKTIMLSTPNKGNVIDQNTSIPTNANNV